MGGALGKEPRPFHFRNLPRAPPWARFRSAIMEGRRSPERPFQNAPTEQAYNLLRPDEMSTMSEHGTQLVCPHCASALSFGTEIVPGAAVECLICSRTFAAQGSPAPAASPAPVASGEREQRPAPKVGILASRPAPSRSRSAVNAPRLAGATPPAEERGMLRLLAGALAMLVGLLLVVGGIAFSLRQRPAPAETPPADPPIAAAPEPAPPAPSRPPTADPAPASAPAPPRAADEPEPEGKKVAAAVALKRSERSKTPEAPAFTTVVPAGKAPATEPAAWLLEPTKVNGAIDRGLQYLRTHSWDGSPTVGYTALAGLTLLECGAPADDPLLKRAAVLVRANARQLNHTYSLALSVLFLDRLGQPEDRTVIQALALRILAGQRPNGGWHYYCPVLPPAEMAALLRFLQSHRPSPPLNMLPGTPANPATKSLPNQKPQPDDPFYQFEQMLSGALKMPENQEPASPGQDGLTKNEPGRSTTKPAVPIRPETLPLHLRSLPIVQILSKTQQPSLFFHAQDDNSNTQFALLALWAARRRDVPSEPALLLAQQRFYKSQTPAGGWCYNLMGDHPSPSMTAVGLLGLAMGHGALARPDTKVPGAKNEDPFIQRGLESLAQHIQKPAKGPADFVPPQSLYFLWSIERVAMLYDLKTIGGKDWYAWGAQTLILQQRPDGSWMNGIFHGSSPHVDTCLALLFLKRSNLVQDLTENLRMYMAIRDSGRGQ